MNLSFWKNRKVFVTGHTGFKGSWLCLWLQNCGAHVVGFALPPRTTPALFHAARVADNMVSIEGNIEDSDSLMEAFGAHQPEVVFHLAAQALVRDSYTDPIGTYRTNVMGSVHVLDAALRTASVRAVVNVTSDKCYEAQTNPNGHLESDPMGGHDPYSSSKGCVELVNQAYRRSFYQAKEKGLASCRAGNVIGGGDWAKDRLVPDLVSHFQNNRTVRIRQPRAIRPWQHVLEPLSGYLEVAEKVYQDPQQYSEGWNFGPFQEDAQEVQWIADRMCAFWGDEAKWEQDGTAHPHENPFLCLNIEKAMNRLAWQPRLNLERALSWTTNWYRQFYLDTSSARDLTLSQIRDYEQREAT